MDFSGPDRFCDSCGAGLGYGREDLTVCTACLMMLREAEEPGCFLDIHPHDSFDEDEF